MGRDRTKIDEYVLLFPFFILYVHTFKLIFNTYVVFVYNHTNWSDAFLQHNIKIPYSISSTIWVVFTGLKMQLFIIY